VKVGRRRQTGPKETPVPVVMLALVTLLWSLSLAAGGCGTPEADEVGAGAAGIKVLATTSCLGDIVQNVAGDRLTIETLLPEGMDPHSFEPTPRDAVTIAESRVIVIDTYGLEPQVDRLIEGVGNGNQRVIVAAEGLEVRYSEGQADPHFWLDPMNVRGYVTNIAAGLSAVDPTGEATYRANADAYTRDLVELDSWIRSQVETVPLERRLLVTNHESLGYFAERYGFQIVGTIFSTAGVEGVPSAQQLTRLIEDIKASGAPAVFLEMGSTGELADQVAREAGVGVVTDLHTHSLSEDAPTYIEMMRWNVGRMVEALR